MDALSSSWENSPVWVHGDLAVGNILISDGQLTAVIDFGQLAIGDPACDLAITWNLFSGTSRQTFRNTLSLDRNTWIRALGWTLWKTLCWPIKGTKVNRILDDVYADYEKLCGF
jgi:aminoglycoside phosphotransferase (APT) family kinase protein